MAIEGTMASSMGHSVGSMAFPVAHFQHSMTVVVRSGRVTAPACIASKPLQVPHEPNLQWRMRPYTGTGSSCALGGAWA